jgi:hypothetical protein
MKALALVNVFSRGALAHAAAVGIGSGTWVYGASVALGRRVLASNRQSTCLPGLPGLRQLCQRRGRDSGHHLPGAAGEHDQMTWPKPRAGLVKTADASGRVGSVGLTAGRPSPDDRGAGCDIVSFVTLKHEHDTIRPTARRGGHLHIIEMAWEVHAFDPSAQVWFGAVLAWMGRSVDRDAKHGTTQPDSQHRLQA